jgi:hypothetical protein
MTNWSFVSAIWHASAKLWSVGLVGFGGPKSSRRGQARIVGPASSILFAPKLVFRLLQRY